MRSGFLFLVGLIFYYVASAARVDTVSIYSNAMHISRKCVVIKPTVHNKVHAQLFPVVYLLHGYSGQYSDWINKVPQIKKYADEYQFIIVCPDGDYSGWYLDSPVDPSFRYETYIGKEVPAYIDQHYPTIKNRKGRAIAGLSMGGHGAFYISLRRPDFFGAAGSMSGVVDLLSSVGKYDISKRIGDTTTNKQNWINYSVIHLIEQKPKDSLALIFDCGNSDAFAPYNRNLHEKMLALKIDHDYIARPGNHNWSYWANAVQYQFLFFHNFFEGQ